MKGSSEFQQFNAAMSSILRADPKIVKATVEAEIQANTAERQARGERKRGRKPATKNRGRVSDKPKKELH